MSGFASVLTALVLITNRKSHMSFRLVPKSLTLNDLERRNGPYSALFHRIRSLPGRTAKRSRLSVLYFEVRLRGPG